MDAISLATLHAAGTAGFLDELRALAAGAGPTPWAHADDPLLAGLERWGLALAERDRAAAVIALCAAAQHAFPQVLAAGGDDLVGVGFRADEPCGDGAPVEAQLAVAAAQARAPRPDRDALGAAFDPTRQLHVWSEDLLPPDACAYHWYLEVGQCAIAALGDDVGDAPDPDDESYYTWPPTVAAARGLVVAARGLRQPGVDLAAVIATLGVAIAAAASRGAAVALTAAAPS